MTSLKSSERRWRHGWVIVGLLAVGACAEASVQTAGLDRILEELTNADSPTVLVVAHRGDWKRAPENSLAAIQSAIALGADIVEVDVAKTSDDELVLMHDPTVDRTTDGHGPVAEMTLADVRRLRLRTADNTITGERVPTLREALRVARNHCVLNLDRALPHASDVHRILTEEGMLGQVIVKGRDSPSALEPKLSSMTPSLMYMPILLDLPSSGLAVDSLDEIIAAINAFAELVAPQAFEVIFANDTTPLLSDSVTALMKQGGARVWVNTLGSGGISGGLSDAAAVQDPDGVWGLLTSRGVNMIQTDETELLLAYLRERGLHW